MKVFVLLCTVFVNIRMCNNENHIGLVYAAAVGALLMDLFFSAAVQTHSAFSLCYNCSDTDMIGKWNSWINSKSLTRAAIVHQATCSRNVSMLFVFGSVCMCQRGWVYRQENVCLPFLCFVQALPHSIFVQPHVCVHTWLWECESGSWYSSGSLKISAAAGRLLLFPSSY